jgi:UDP-GlcNAc3NAcA epimerase
MKKIIAIIGARPQFIKHAPLEMALKKYFQTITIHTGQHYDAQMSHVFFTELGMSPPQYLLQVGSHQHGKQTGLMMIEIENIISDEKPDAVLVYGDTNSTLAGALVASKLHIPIIHIEAGLRSFNREMPEEINRILTDQVSSLLFVPTEGAIQNLKNEGITEGVILSGDVMRDAINLAQQFVKKPPFDHPYYLATIHRPYNTDEKERLTDVLKALNTLDLPVLFPIHPRTKANMNRWAMPVTGFPNITFSEPVSYFDLINLQTHASAVITDSGGIQKEAYWLKKKCVTLRSETEWVETLEQGWNTLVFSDLKEIQTAIKKPVGAYISDLYGKDHVSEDIATAIYEWIVDNG